MLIYVLQCFYMLALDAWILYAMILRILLMWILHVKVFKVVYS